MDVYGTSFFWCCHVEQRELVYLQVFFQVFFIYDRQLVLNLFANSEELIVASQTVHFRHLKQ